MIYQITFLLEDEKDKNIVSDAIEAAAGKVLDERLLGKRKLAYPIKKLQEANYFTFHFEIDPENLEKLDKNLNLQDKILRYIILRTETIVKPVETKIEEKPVKPVAVAPKLETKKDIKKVEKVKPVKVEKVSESQVSESERLQALEEKLKELLKE